jgi:ATP-dependent Lhr-like helicase
VIERLQGFEAPAPAWEDHILPARIRAYRGSDLEELCLSGAVTWGRPSGSSAEPDEGRRRAKAGRGTPLTFALREDLPTLRPPAPSLGDVLDRLSPRAVEIAEHLAARGASFLSEIARSTGRLPAEVEDALWELVSEGLVSGDGVAGLRSLLRGAERPTRRFRSLPGGRPARHLPAGRWALWEVESDTPTDEERLDAIASQLLRRYGVVFRELMVRERNLPPWRELARRYRRWEAQGRIRGGRFVSGFVGEQFALPEAVEGLRAARRAEDEEPVLISAADPLNLVGILLPGERVSPRSGLRVALLRGGVAGVGALGDLRSRLRTAGISA